MNQTTSPLPPGRVLLRLPDVLRKTGLSRSTVYRLISAGQFPGQVTLTANTSAWDVAEIDAWIASREAATRREVA